MAKWETANLGELIPTTEMQDILDSADTAVTAMQSAASTLSGVSALMQASTIEFVDPVRTTLRELISLITDFISDFEATGGYFLSVPPSFLGDRSAIAQLVLDNILPPGWEGWWPTSMTLDEFVAKVSTSFYDTADMQRPRFTPSAEVGGIVILASMPAATPETLIETLQAIEFFFGPLPLTKEIGEILTQMVESSQYALTESFATPPPGATTVISVNAQLPNPSIQVDNSNVFPPTGQVWVKLPSFDPAGSRWRSTVPVSYVKEGAVLYLDVVEYQRLFATAARGSVPQVGDWAIYSENFRAVEYWSLRSQAPDWNRLQSLGQFWGGTYTIIEHLKRIAAVSEVGISAANAVEQLNNLVTDRIDELSRIISDAKEIINNFPPALESTGIHYTIVTANGVDEFVSELEAASDPPDVGEGSVSWGFVLFGGAAGVEAIKRFFFE